MRAAPPKPSCIYQLVFNGGTGVVGAKALVDCKIWAPKYGAFMLNDSQARNQPGNLLALYLYSTDCCSVSKFIQVLKIQLAN